jgi:hypothetical protein
MILRRWPLSKRPQRGVTPLIATPFTHELDVPDGASTDFDPSRRDGRRLV